MTIEFSAEDKANLYILKAQVEQLITDNYRLKDEIDGLHREMASLRSVIDNLDRNGMLKLQEATH